MYKLIIFLLLSFSGLSFAQASDLPIKNAGFVPANIWYSKDPFYAGETVRIYTIVFNGSTYDLTGAVEFLDNGKAIGKTNFSLAGSGRVEDLWVDWKAGSGAHTITARLMNVVADGPSGKQAVILDNSETGKSDRVIVVDPAIAAAESKALEEKVGAAKNKTIDTLSGVASTVSDAIPPPVKDTISGGANILEKFRIGESYQFQVARANAVKDIEALKASSGTRAMALQKSGSVIDSITDKTKEPFAYIILAFYTLLQYIFRWPVLFYGLILYAIYRFIKLISSKIKNR